MHGYSIALFLHLLSLLLAVVAATLTGLASFGLRSAQTAPEAARWGALVGRVVPFFPVATLGLLGTGAYMTQDVWSWSTPWIDASIAGLALIVFLGAVVEGGRGRALEQELRSSGLSERARALTRDPAAWSARVVSLAVIVAVVWTMTEKPGAGGAAAALLVAVAVGLAGAVPLWRAPAVRGVSEPA